MPDDASSKPKKECEGGCDCPDCGAGKPKTEKQGKQ